MGGYRRNAWVVIAEIRIFGIHTANVVQLADRIEQRAQLVVA